MFVIRWLDKLGVSYNPLFCEPNGIFPHNPEPLPENLRQISSELETGNYDLGIVVDPDVDRLALICENGEPFGEEYTLVAVADYVLSQKKGNTVSNLSSTRALRDVTEKHGGEYFSSSVGEVHVVSQMKAVDAVIEIAAEQRSQRLLREPQLYVHNVGGWNDHGVARIFVDYKLKEVLCKVDFADSAFSV